MSTDKKTPNPASLGSDQVIRPASISSEEAVGTPTLWITASFAQLWFADARAEASRVDADGRRREILFAVAAAESCLLEWVRDDVLNHNFSELDRFFPPGERRPIIDKWVEGDPEGAQECWPNRCRPQPRRRYRMEGI